MACCGLCFPFQHNPLVVGILVSVTKHSMVSASGSQCVFGYDALRLSVDWKNESAMTQTACEEILQVQPEPNPEETNHAQLGLNRFQFGSEYAGMCTCKKKTAPTTQTMSWRVDFPFELESNGINVAWLSHFVSIQERAGAL